MQTLGMPGGRFEVDVTTSADEIGPHGMDTIEFLVSANPGQPPKNLAKVASGGELSRISLAIQVAAAAKTAPSAWCSTRSMPASAARPRRSSAGKLRALGDRGQVLCVTHLAQVASQAHCQWRVTKRSDGKTTRTTVERLSDADRVDEIARMLGGIDVSDEARAHAKGMLARASAREAVKEKKSSPARRRGR